MVLTGFTVGYVSGAIGMGYGVISTSLLLATGIAPRIASASTRVVKTSIALVAGISHWRFGNLRRDIETPMILLGMVGGVLGVYILCSLSSYEIKPFIAVFLLMIGFTVFFRFLLQKRFLLEQL